MAIIKPMFCGAINLNFSNWAVRRGATNYNTGVTATHLSAYTIQTLLSAAMAATGGGSCLFAPSSTPGAAGTLLAANNQGRLAIQANASFTIQPPSVGLNAWPYFGFTQATVLVNAVNNPTLFPLGWGIIADRPPLYTWCPEVPPYSDSLPTSERANSTNGRSMAGRALRVDEPTVINREWSFRFIPGRKMSDKMIGANDRTLQSFMENVNRFRLFEDQSVNTFEDYTLAQESVQLFKPTRQYQGVALYSHDLKAWRYV